jgi:uncharacterized membrane protein
MKKSKHFTFAAVAFGISSVGFLIAQHMALGAGVAALAATYAILAFRAHDREQRDSGSN